MDDAERRLAEVSGDAQFAHDFFERFILGREAPDYARLLLPAGFLLRKVNPGRAWWGDVRLNERNGLRVAAAPLANTPAYKAGLDQDDEVRSIDGTRVTSSDAATNIVGRHRPGDTVQVEFVDRAGNARTTRIVLAEDPRSEVVPIESAGGVLTASQKAFREAWLGRK